MIFTHSRHPAPKDGSMFLGKFTGDLEELGFLPALWDQSDGDWHVLVADFTEMRDGTLSSYFQRYYEADDPVEWIDYGRVIASEECKRRLMDMEPLPPGVSAFDQMIPKVTLENTGGAMSVQYEEGKIRFHLADLLRWVPAEDRVALIEELSCEDAIIKHVADQIIDRWTENWSCGGSVCTMPADASRGCPLDEAWRRVAKASGDVAKEEIEKLERALGVEREKTRELETQLRILAEKKRSQCP